MCSNAIDFCGSYFDGEFYLFRSLIYESVFEWTNLPTLVLIEGRAAQFRQSNLSLSVVLMGQPFRISTAPFTIGEKVFLE